MLANSNITGLLGKYIFRSPWTNLRIISVYTYYSHWKKDVSMERHFKLINSYAINK